MPPTRKFTTPVALRLPWVSERNVQLGEMLEQVAAFHGKISSERKARGFRTLRTIRTVIFMLAGKLDFSRLNPHIQRLPT